VLNVIVGKRNLRKIVFDEQGRRIVRRIQQDKIMEIERALRSASPEVLDAALRALRDGSNGDGERKKPRKRTKFYGTDHQLSREEFAALCDASTPFYRLLWRLMLGHGLRVSEALGLRAQNVQNGFLCVQRLKGSEYTRQPLLVDLSSRLATGSYRIFPCHRSSAYLHFRKAAAKVGIDRDRQHDHVLRHTCICWMLAAGVPVHVVSRYVGHRSINSTSQYMNCSDLAAAKAAGVVGQVLEGIGEPISKPPVDVMASAAAQELIATL
jgi:integrase/recombinase XerD